MRRKKDHKGMSCTTFESCRRAQSRGALKTTHGITRISRPPAQHGFDPPKKQLASSTSAQVAEKKLKRALPGQVFDTCGAVTKHWDLLREPRKITYLLQESQRGGV